MKAPIRTVDLSGTVSLTPFWMIGQRPPGRDLLHLERVAIEVLGIADKVTIDGTVTTYDCVEHAELVVATMNEINGSDLGLTICGSGK